jgi:hypothetical protein
MPSWIIETLGCSINPAGETAMPNFMAESMGKGSMQTPHHRALLDGAVAAQGDFRNFTLYDIEESPFDKAFVGTIESNAEILIGNAHWAAKPRDKTRKVEYHMRRVFHHFTRGITLRDFLICREQARQFRRQFYDVQEDLLAKLRNVRVATPKPDPIAITMLRSSKHYVAREKSELLESRQT